MSSTVLWQSLWHLPFAAFNNFPLVLPVCAPSSSAGEPLLIDWLTALPSVNIPLHPASQRWDLPSYLAKILLIPETSNTVLLWVIFLRGTVATVKLWLHQQDGIYWSLGEIVVDCRIHNVQMGYCCPSMVFTLQNSVQWNFICIVWSYSRTHVKALYTVRFKTLQI